MAYPASGGFTPRSPPPPPAATASAPSSPVEPRPSAGFAIARLAPISRRKPLTLPSPREERGEGKIDLNARHANYPDLLLLVFCVRLPCAACSRMLCFSSSRWPLVVSRGTAGALPGPLWLWLSSGTGLIIVVSGFVMQVSIMHTGKTPVARASFPNLRGPALRFTPPAAHCRR